ncbi:MAG: hypothetical protein K6L76_10520 [Agarilytica sp.]
MKYSRLLLSSAFLASSLSYADYQFEVDAALSFGGGTIDSGGFETDYDVSGANLGATVYIGSVSTGGVPLQEAGFLSKLSYGSLSMQNEDFDIDDSGDISDEFRTLAGRAVIADKVILGAEYIKNERQNTFFDRESTVLGFEAGAYLSDINTLVVSYSQEDIEWNDGDEADVTSFGVSFEQVNRAGGSQYIAWNATLEKITYAYPDNFDQDDLSIGGGLTFYFNNSFGVGADLNTILIDSGEYDGAQSTFSPHVTYEFNENVGVYLVTDSQAVFVEYDDGEEYEESSVVYTFGVSARF